MCNCKGHVSQASNRSHYSNAVAFIINSYALFYLSPRSVRLAKPRCTVLRTVLAFCIYGVVAVSFLRLRSGHYIPKRLTTFGAFCRD